MLKNKNILVLGLGISGISTIKFLAQEDCNIIVYDSKTQEELKESLEKIQPIDYQLILGEEVDLGPIDLIVKSPGIPPSNRLLVQARSRKIPVISDLELGYLYRRTENIIAITGTNGKTSTTSLVASMFQGIRSSYTCGNIGIGILATMEKAQSDSVVIIEASSFQLEDTRTFKPKLAALINLSPDHLDWHGSYENYIKAKLKIFKNQDESDVSVINADDPLILEASKNLKSKKIYFSSKRPLEDGFYLEEDKLVYVQAGQKKLLVGKDELDIFPENALVGLALGLGFGLELEDMVQALKGFQALAHRMEFVRAYRGLKFYNDSKGTNPESTSKALEKLEGSIALIAGGYDKGSSFDELLKMAQDKVRALILMGQTRDKLKLAGEKLGYKHIYLVKDMEEAVGLALDLDLGLDTVLLSPACASWGAYHNFEERGDHFKKIVNEIR